MHNTAANNNNNMSCCNDTPFCATPPPTNDDFIQKVGADTTIWSPSQQRYAKAKDEFSNKVIVLYFSSFWCKPCKQFTPYLLDLYKQLKARGVDDFEFVYCSMDAFQNEYEHYTSTMPWWCFCFQCPTSARLAHLYKANGIPSVVVIDKDGSVISNDAVNQVASDPKGLHFPWRPQTLVEMLPEHYLHHENNNHNNVSLRPTQTLDDQYLLLYAAGSWCEPCRTFTQKLSRAYETLKQHRSDFEILFLSSDQDQQAFDDFYAQMPFGAIPFEERAAKQAIANQFAIRKVPTLMMFGPKPRDGGDRPLISADVRHYFESESGDFISEFPFQPKRYGDLNRTTHDINTSKCIVVFSEYCDDCEQEDAEEALKCAADSYMGEEDIKFFWVTSPTPFTQTLRSALKLPTKIPQDAIMLLLDFPDNGGYYVSSERQDISTSAVLEFLENPGQRLVCFLLLREQKDGNPFLLLWNDERTLTVS